MSAFDLDDEKRKLLYEDLRNKYATASDDSGVQAAEEARRGTDMASVIGQGLAGLGAINARARGTSVPSSDGYFEDVRRSGRQKVADARDARRETMGEAKDAIDSTWQDERRGRERKEWADSDALKKSENDPGSAESQQAQALAKKLLPSGNFDGMSAAQLKRSLPTLETMYKVDEQKRASESKGDPSQWVSTGQVDEQGNLISLNSRTGQMRAGAKVGTKPGSSDSKPYEYRDADGNKRIGKYHDGVGLVQSPSDQIVEPFRPSVDQSKQAGLVQSGGMANAQYESAIAKGKSTDDYDPTSSLEFIDNSTSIAPNWMKSNAAIEAHAAQSSWVESYLRDASGAAIPAGERMSYAADYFPQPGDSKQALANKKALREQKERSAALAAGPALDRSKPVSTEKVEEPAPGQATAGVGRQVVSKQYSPSRDKTKIIYSDDTEEVVDGRK